MKKPSAPHIPFPLLAAIGVLLIGIAILSWFLYTATAARQALQEDYDATVASTTSRIAELENVLLETKSLLEDELAENEALSENLEEEKGRNEEFADQIGEISKTVGVLDKLSKTDEELLQKYSKVYFLNEHYIPSDLSEIDNEWKYSETRTHPFHSKAMPFLEDMLEDAKKDGIKLWVASSYRSFSEQASLKGRYTTTYGSGANTFSADQGYSEHQLGTTLDFTTEGLGGGLTGFENTPAYAWLLENAHKYGFTMSYPPNNTYYVYEPWHWRFVGEKLAEDLHDANAYFYDWDQRKINEYLVNIFD